jgi:4-amino-4-deoxy-L-arabinose transferase-like glycosyltransferase
VTLSASAENLRPVRARRWVAVVLVFATLVLWFVSIEHRKLVNPDEGRYAEIPREMLASGDWLTPRLNNIKYFEKPPLQYWVTAAIYRVFGFDEWTARLWPSVTGLLGILLTGFAGWRLFGKETGVAASLILLSSVYYVIFANVLTLDMGFTFFLSLVLVGYLMAQRDALQPRVRTAWMLAAWAAMGLAVLSKGLAGAVLPALALITYTAMQRDRSGWRNLRMAVGVPLMLLIAAPWFVSVSMANPEFFQFFFIHEHLQRFTGTMHHRSGPWWYFIPVLVVALFPWLVLLAEAALRAWRHESARGAFSPRRFLLAWAVSQLVFFSLSGSKLPAYVLPILPALALLIATRIVELDGVQIAKRVTPLALLAGLACFVGTEAMEAMHRKSIEFDYYEDYSVWLETASVIMVAASLLLWWQRRAKRVAVVAFCLSLFLASELIIAGFEHLSPLQSAYSLAQKVKPLLRPSTPLFLVEMYNQSLPPYLGRPVTLVAYEDELYFGLQQEPERGIPTLGEFAALWPTLPEGVAIMPIKTFEKLKAAGLPMQVVGAWRDLQIIKVP